ncbi:MAG: hypothetical protein HKN85_00800 [Gammaproteobacteria bacterium]|nr:hypothetical protein [Gammaproteobacteria bacterium]
MNPQYSPVASGPSAFASAEIQLEDFIDLDRFPIHDLTSPLRREIVEKCRADLQSVGCSHVADFIRAGAVRNMREEALRLLPQAWSWQDISSPYFVADDPSLPQDHPKRFFERRSSSYINSDLLEPQSQLRKIYDSDVVVHFFCDCLNVGPIYRWADPLARNPYGVMVDGDYFPWHFDGNDFTVSILVQESDEGGVFEYCPHVRSAHNENFDRVKAVLSGDRSEVKVLPLKHGDLQLFKGRYSMHRVTTTRGPNPRLIALPSYVTNPYLVNRAHHSEVLYGRSLPIHHQRNLQRLDDLTD